jgi:hypothetical protein
MDFADSIARMDATCLRVFGRKVTYLPETGGQATVRAVFQPTREAEESVIGVYAVLFVRAAELPSVPQRGDEVEVDGQRYKVFEIEADTSGASVLRLRQV